jgi:hypothetical protein
MVGPSRYHPHVRTANGRSRRDGRRRIDTSARTTKQALFHLPIQRCNKRGVIRLEADHAVKGDRAMAAFSFTWTMLGFCHASRKSARCPGASTKSSTRSKSRTIRRIPRVKNVGAPNDGGAELGCWAEEATPPPSRATTAKGGPRGLEGPSRFANSDVYSNRHCGKEIRMTAAALCCSLSNRRYDGVGCQHERRALVLTWLEKLS